jgi:predicted flap endonuclease-1-like 5' DNA nuclease
VREIQGVGPERSAALAVAGIVTRQELLDRGATPEGRAQIAEQSQLGEKLIASWVSAVDLTRVPGVGPQNAELIEAAGVATVGDLAQQDAASLHEKLVEVNASRNLVRVVPGVSQIEKAIETAKGLPQVVTV